MGGAFAAPECRLRARTIVVAATVLAMTFAVGLIALWDVVIAERLYVERQCLQYDNASDLVHDVDGMPVTPDSGGCLEAFSRAAETRVVHRVLWPDLRRRATDSRGC